MQSSKSRNQHMKLALAIILTSLAFVPYAMARVGLKPPKLNSQKPMDPHKVQLAPVPTLKDTTEEHRIVGGEVARQGEFPFYVFWIDYDGNICSGSLIHEDIILTAAHCSDIGTDEIFVGTYYLESMVPDEEKQYIEIRWVHPNFDEDTLLNDVMVIKIFSPSFLLPVALNNDSASPSVGEDVVVIGLGETTDGGNMSSVLLKVTIPIVGHDQCAADYVGFSPIVEDITLCAGLQEGGKDSCGGDSGGPLLELRGGEYVQVGITSWGHGCAQPNFPGVYTRVSGVKSWIDEMICELSNNPPASCNSTDNPPASCNSTDKSKTGLIVGLVATGIAAMGLVAFFLKRRTNRKPVSPHDGSESDAVVKAIPIEDGANTNANAPMKVPGKPPSMVDELTDCQSAIDPLSEDGKTNVPPPCDHERRKNSQSALSPKDRIRDMKKMTYRADLPHEHRHHGHHHHDHDGDDGRTDEGEHHKHKHHKKHQHSRTKLPEV